jgi:hypothetical protein
VCSTLHLHENSPARITPPPPRHWCGQHHCSYRDTYSPTWLGYNQATIQTRLETTNTHQPGFPPRPPGPQLPPPPPRGGAPSVRPALHPPQHSPARMPHKWPKKLALGFSANAMNSSAHARYCWDKRAREGRAEAHRGHETATATVGGWCCMVCPTVGPRSTTLYTVAGERTLEAHFESCVDSFAGGLNLGKLL